jgi:Phosphotransferase enzyme family
VIRAGRLETVLRERWDVLCPGVPAPARFSFLVVTKGREAGGKIVVLVFADRQSTPCFVIKVARLKGREGSLDTEYRNLTTVAPHAAHGRVIVPRPLFRGYVDGRLCVIESFVDGMELVHAPERSAASALDAIVDWLIHLGGATAHSVNDDGLVGIIAAARSYAVTSEERRVIDQVADLMRGLHGEPLPRVFEHRDLGTWNVLLARDGTVGVLDWESSSPDGVAAWDLFYFLAHYGFLLDRARDLLGRLASVRETFLGARGFGATAAVALRRYASAMDLREESLPPLFAGCWLHHAVSEVSRRRGRLSESLFWQILVTTLARDGGRAEVASR